MAGAKKLSGGSTMATVAVAPAVVQPPAFLGSVDGVSVLGVEGSRDFAVALDFDRQLSAMMRGVPGAEFDKASQAYFVPGSSAEALGKVAGAMRAEFKAIEADREAIMELAEKSGMAAQREYGSTSGATPKVGNYIKPGEFYGGEIVNVNARFAAQVTGFGERDGAAFVKIHRLADLDNGKMMKGDFVGIKYDDKFRGVVSDLSKNKSGADLEAEYVGNLGKVLDGVTVTERGDKIGIAFDLTPETLARIRRVDGAAFEQEGKVWEVPARNKEFALRAVHDMRGELAADNKERSMMQAIAEGKVDGAKLSNAFTKDGQSHYGSAVAVGERFAMQAAGQGNFRLHHLSALDQKPVVGANLAVTYKKGVGTVVDQDLKRAQDKALGQGR